MHCTVYHQPNNTKTTPTKVALFVLLLLLGALAKQGRFRLVVSLHYSSPHCNVVYSTKVPPFSFQLPISTFPKMCEPYILRVVSHFSWLLSWVLVSSTAFFSCLHCCLANCLSFRSLLLRELRMAFFSSIVFFLNFPPLPVAWSIIYYNLRI